MEKEKSGLKIHCLGLKDMAGWLKKNGLIGNLFVTKDDIFSAKERKRKPPFGGE